MKISRYIFFGFLFASINLFTGCDSDSSEDEQIYANEQVSGCGGFRIMEKESIAQSTVEDTCADERLIWQYDQETQTVNFLNENILAGCSGEFSISIIWDEVNDVYEIVETDSFTGVPLPCLPCLFDLGIDLLDVTPGTISIKLTRDDDIVWEGELDLTEDEGDILIRENVGVCDE